MAVGESFLLMKVVLVLVFFYVTLLPSYLVAGTLGLTWIEALLSRVLLPGRPT